MAFTEALRLVVDADTRGAIQGVEKLGATADRELSRSQSSLDKWGNRLTAVGTGMVAFGAAAVAGLGALAMESEQANLAQVKLQNTIDNMPKLAGATASEFTDLAESIQKVTAADADAIVEAEALLGTFNLTADEIKGITPLVVDYARKFGIDMADAAIQVGKALDGQVGALKRNGVSIDEALFATDRYRAVQEALSDQVGGFAEAEGRTFAGSLARMKNELGDLAEGVGGGAVDAFTTMFGAVGKVAGALESISPGTQTLIGQVATFGAVGLIAAGGVSTLIGQAIKARENFASFGSAVSDGITKLGGLRTAAGLAAGATGLLALGAAIEQFNQAQQRSNIERMTAQFLAAGESAAEMRDVLQTLVDQGPAELVGTFAQLAETNRVAAERFIETAEAAGASGRVIDEMKAHLETMGEASKQSAADTDEFSGSVDSATASVEGASAAVKSYGDTLRAQFDPLFGAISAQQQLEDANNKVTAAEMALAAAIDEHGASSLEAMVATQELNRAQVDAGQAAVGQQVAVSNLRDAVANGTVSIDDAKAALNEWAAQGRITAGSAAAAAAEFDRLGREADSLDGRNVTIDVITRQTTVLAGSRNIPLRAHGGPVLAGQPYIVGEQRPELFVPNQSGRIVPSVPGGGGNGGVQHVHEHIYVQIDGSTVAQADRDYRRNNGLDWRN